ncbi:uncharacterized protein N7511_008705 [Penicillium nucicola]|uniref:uncharacterized protein n=1 Tax=Penicillium nucicola TaxID=1850975 RepID=UPI002544E5BD|nr:uncharacterized protein N7511_008705 [Penicillium nucicola]KAJ5747009.1 hypothetical protein N7511_008705 [Penicillium nucicola]
MASNYAPKQIFVSKRLFYRAIEDNEEDKTFIKQKILNDHTIQAMSTNRLPRPAHSADDLVKMFREAMLGVMICLQPEHQSSDDTELPSNIETSKATIIGHMGIFNHLGPETSHHRNVMLGISLASDFRGKGYGGEAINWGLDWAFLHAGLHRVGLAAFSYNESAVRLYRKLGFVQDGREREAVYHRRVWHDVILFSMLEHEWESLRGIEKS